MRIALNMLFVTPGLAGGRVYCEGLLRGLADVDNQNEYAIFTRSETELPALPTDRFHQWRAPILEWSTVGRTLWEYGRLPGVVRRGGFDLLHGLGSLSPAPRGCPTVLTIHDLIYRRFPQTVPRGHRWFMQAVLPILARRAARVIVPSRNTANDVVKQLRVSEHKISIVPYGCGQDFQRIADIALCEMCLRKLGLRRPYIISVCRSYPHKNLAGLLRAFARLRQRRHDLQLVLVGERYQTGAALDRLTAELGMRDAVVFTGFVDQATLNILYSSAAVFAFPSLAEGLGLPVLEAMSCGTPVVASQASAVPEAVGAAGIVADAENPAEFADALDQVLGDDRLRDELQKKGLARAKEFSWQRCARETLAVYHSALNNFV
jgi:glycosyltransferase involved in cell wall biosynthesis